MSGEFRTLHRKMNEVDTLVTALEAQKILKVFEILAGDEKVFASAHTCTETVLHTQHLSLAWCHHEPARVHDWRDMRTMNIAVHTCCAPFAGEFAVHSPWPLQIVDTRQLIECLPAAASLEAQFDGSNVTSSSPHPNPLPLSSSPRPGSEWSSPE